ncbi:CLUMA_CG013428, isoform A [Clunio marinus]|uniref:CLUMA_CG013428, isoform A n=1 Tax=Clunio marinus TaxID=568069 RepID=A0A1J1IIX8_9DIPT|nr:CLUMA_CG013428, isoform A [Clunio marinus]
MSLTIVHNDIEDMDECLYIFTLESTESAWNFKFSQSYVAFLNLPQAETNVKLDQIILNEKLNEDVKADKEKLSNPKHGKTKKCLQEESLRNIQKGKKLNAILNKKNI